MKKNRSKILLAFTVIFHIGIIFLLPLGAETASSGPADALGSESKLTDYKLHIPVGATTEITKADFVSGRSIPVYISVLYRWFVGFTLVLGVIALMAGGAVWILAGGNKGTVDKAKGIIKNSLVGIFLALGSYLFLWTMSPNLVQFKPIRVSKVQLIGTDIKYYNNPPEDEEAKIDHCKDCREEGGPKFTTHYCFDAKEECRERIKKDQGPCTNTIECVLGLSCNLATKKCEDGGTNPLGLCCNIMKEEVFDKNGNSVSGSASYFSVGFTGGGKKRKEDCSNVNTPPDLGYKDEETGVFPLTPDQTVKRSFVAGKKMFCILACPTLKKSDGTWVQPIDASRGCSVPPVGKGL
ncbi:hypothetical protein HY621_01640 [Candidatus Uhrbacteria bacterium]|nr:hypothetical protein [Candidatus Uhrbacteria bacterium]